MQIYQLRFGLVWFFIYSTWNVWGYNISDVDAYMALFHGQKKCFMRTRVCVRLFEGRTKFFKKTIFSTQRVSCQVLSALSPLFKCCSEDNFTIRCLMWLVCLKLNFFKTNRDEQMKILIASCDILMSSFWYHGLCWGGGGGGGYNNLNLVAISWSERL